MIYKNTNHNWIGLKSQEIQNITEIIDYELLFSIIKVRMPFKQFPDKNKFLKILRRYYGE